MEESSEAVSEPGWLWGESSLGEASGVVSVVGVSRVRGDEWEWE